MSKYIPLWKHIGDNGIESMTFDEIMEVLGFEIDHSFLNFKKELTEYGYTVKKIHLKERVVGFIKAP